MPKYFLLNTQRTTTTTFINDITVEEGSPGLERLRTTALEGNDWSAVPICAPLYQWPRGYFRSEYCIGGKSMTIPRVRKLSLCTHPLTSGTARGYTGHKHVFQVFRMIRPGIEPSLLVSDARAQPKNVCHLWKSIFAALCFVAQRPVRLPSYYSDPVPPQRKMQTWQTQIYRLSALVVDVLQYKFFFA